MSVSVAELKADLSKLLKRAAEGEEIEVTRHGKPMVRIVAVEAPARKKSLIGGLKGKIWMADDFDAPLEEFEEYM